MKNRLINAGLPRNIVCCWKKKQLFLRKNTAPIKPGFFPWSNSYSSDSDGILIIVKKGQNCSCFQRRCGATLHQKMSNSGSLNSFRFWIQYQGIYTINTRKPNKPISAIRKDLRNQRNQYPVLGRVAEHNPPCWKDQHTETRNKKFLGGTSSKNSKPRKVSQKLPPDPWKFFYAINCRCCLYLRYGF